MHAAGPSHRPWIDTVPADPGACLRILIGHADAGASRAGDPGDSWRPLSSRGHRRARRLVSHLRGVRIDQVLSGPSLRCRQTVVPLALDRGLDIEPVRPLATGTDLAELAAFVAHPSTANAVLCTDPLTLTRLLAYLDSAAWTEIVVSPAGSAVVLSFGGGGTSRSAER